MSYPIDEISAKLGQINFQGNVIPASWKDHIRYRNRPDLNAIFLLSEIVYWYRPILTRDEQGNEVWLKKYKADFLQKGFRQLESATGLSKKQIREALERLESLGLLKRHTRSIESYVKDSDEIRRTPNVLFIEIFPHRIEEITNSSLKKEVLSLPTWNYTFTHREQRLSPQVSTYTETTTKTTPKNTFINTTTPTPPNRIELSQVPTEISIELEQDGGGGGFEKNFSETIFYKTPLGEEKSVNSSEIYSHFLKLNFSSEILMEAIQKAKLCTDPIGNIFRYIEGICQRLEISKAKKNISIERKEEKKPIS